MKIMWYNYGRQFVHSIKNALRNKALHVDYVDKLSDIKHSDNAASLNQARISCRVLCFINKQSLDKLDLVFPQTESTSMQRCPNK